MLAACLMLPTNAHAWGFAAHKYIMGRALTMLPPELKGFFEPRRAEVVMRSTDPDLWRNVGWKEDPNHFLDFGVEEYGKPPFAALPRDYGAALEKFGPVTLERNGLLPWRLAEMFGQLRRAFEGAGRNAQYALSNIVLYTAVVSHYMQDAHQPLHATDNYDGGKTRQQGVHARFERDLFERFETRLTINPVARAPITTARDAAFDVLIESNRLVEPLLAADRAAAQGRTLYDDAYFARFFEGVRPLLQQQLSAAIAATAALITGAWEEAGKPALREVPRPPERISPRQ
jgi:hypothetical protein